MATSDWAEILKPVQQLCTLASHFTPCYSLQSIAKGLHKAGRASSPQWQLTQESGELSPDSWFWLDPEYYWKECLYINYSVSKIWGLPGGSVAKNTLANQETWVQSLGGEDPLEKEMATHSSIAWEIPWTEELVVYSPWSCRVGQDWMTKQQKQQIVDLECCVSSRYTAKWFSYTYTCIYSFSNSFPT